MKNPNEFAIENMAFNYREALANFIVIKKGDHFYCDELTEKEEAMTKRQLYKLLNKLYGTGPEEIALMLLDAKENKLATKFFFGMNGYYLFCK